MKIKTSVLCLLKLEKEVKGKSYETNKRVVNSEAVSWEISVFAGSIFPFLDTEELWESQLLDDA